MKTTSKALAVAAISLLATASAFAQNPGMKSPPFYPSMTQGTPNSPVFASHQAAGNDQQADRARTSHSVVQMGERNRNSPYSNS
jgi:hypothetical protein